MSDTTASCRCGAVQCKITGEPYSIGHCHCESCRRSTGQAAVTLLAFRKSQVVFGDDAGKIHESSPGVYRRFCPNCGTPLTWEADWDGYDDVIEIYIGAMAEPDRYPAVKHVYYDERVSWFDIADHLPRYISGNRETPVSREPAFPPESKAD